MSTRGATLVGTLVLLAMAMFALRPVLVPVAVAVAPEPGPAPRSDVTFVATATEADATRAPTAAAAASPSWRLLPQPAPATPSVGVAAVLRQPRFSPRIDIEAEVWAAFVASRAGDQPHCWPAMADRLARLGLECRREEAWAGGSVDVGMTRDAGEVLVALVVTTASVGLARLTAGASVVAIPLVGVATIDVGGTNPDGEVLAAWAWSASAFPGPHRLPGSAVPSGALRVVLVTAREPLTLAFAEPLFLPAGTRGTPCVSRQRRALDLAPAGSGPVALRCRAEGWRSIDVPLASAADRPVRIVEVGDRFGDYGQSLASSREAPAPPPSRK